MPNSNAIASSASPGPAGICLSSLSGPQIACRNRPRREIRGDFAPIPVRREGLPRGVRPARGSARAEIGELRQVDLDPRRIDLAYVKIFVHQTAPGPHGAAQRLNLEIDL